jgi:hypothetical protein
MEIVLTSLESTSVATWVQRRLLENDAVDQKPG